MDAPRLKRQIDLLNRTGERHTFAKPSMLIIATGILTVLITHVHWLAGLVTSLIGGAAILLLTLDISGLATEQQITEDEEKRSVAVQDAINVEEDKRYRQMADYAERLGKAEEERDEARRDLATKKAWAANVIAARTQECEQLRHKLDASTTKAIADLREARRAKRDAELLVEQAHEIARQAGRGPARPPLAPPPPPAHDT